MLLRCPCNQCCPILLACSTFFSVVSGDVPPVHNICNEGAGKGLLLGRKAVANAFSVTVEHIHSLPRGMVRNVDDMVCMYSTEQGFVVTNEEKGLVLKDNVNGPLNSSYGVHFVQTKLDGKEFKGIKFRYTTGLISSGHMTPIFMQVSGLVNEEMPPDKLPSGVEIIPIGDLAADGSVGLESTTVGYLALCHKGVGNEPTMFKEYQTSYIQPTVDAAWRCLELDPDNPLARFVNTTDGGVTQLAAAISEESFDKKTD